MSNPDVKLALRIHDVRYFTPLVLPTEAAADLCPRLSYIEALAQERYLPTRLYLGMQW